MDCKEHKRVTIHDLSKASGFSTATISRVFSNKGNVKKETRDLILACADELGYEYARKKTSPEQLPLAKVMIIVNNISLPYYVSIMQSAIDELESLGCRAMIFQTGEKSTLEDAFKIIQADHYAGAIMLTATDTPELAELLNQNFCPVVLANRNIYSVDTTSVCPDEFSGAYMATKFLLDKGHTKIANLAGPICSSNCMEQRRGYAKALMDAGLQPEDKAIFSGTLQRSSGIQFAPFFINHLPGYTAVLCANEVMAVAFIDEMISRGYSIPKDASVICIDDTYMAVSAKVNLTTVSSDCDSIGRVSARLLVDIINGKEIPNRTVLFPSVLTERDSVWDLNDAKSFQEEENSPPILDPEE